MNKTYQELCDELLQTRQAWGETMELLERVRDSRDRYRKERDAALECEAALAAPELYVLLEIAACPCCDGSGAYYDGYGEVCQCQWCDERTKVIAKARGES